jgi:hypothetical protein
MKTYMAAARMLMVGYGKTHDFFMNVQFAVGLTVCGIKVSLHW